MPGCVLDASILLAFLLPDERPPDHLDLSRMLNEGVLVTPHWPFEVANGVVMAQRRGRIGIDAVSGYCLVARMPVSVDQQSSVAIFSATLDVALQHDLTIYDAAYVELARRRRMRLATLDRELAHAARIEGVEML